MRTAALLPHRLRRALGYALYDRLVAAVLDTPPLSPRAGPVRIVSQLHPRDLRMYLVAAKSFYARLGVGSFVVLVDEPGLDAAGRRLLADHLGGAVAFRTVAEVETGDLPRGGTWERLVTCLELAREHYVIQLDADTLTLGPLHEVVEAVGANRPFLLGEGEPVLSCREAAERAEPDDHVVDVAQRALATLPDAGRLLYVRGSSGFAGFPAGTDALHRLAWFHRRMAERLGPRWRAWGSEQVASNFVLANLPGVRPLPWPDYATWRPGIDPRRLRFGHFIGTFRFRRQILARLSRRVLRELRAAAGEAAGRAATPGEEHRRAADGSGAEDRGDAFNPTGRGGAGCGPPSSGGAAGPAGSRR